MLEAVLFDVDVIIVDSEELYYQAVCETFRPFRVDMAREEYVRRYMLEKTTSRGVIEDYNLEKRFKVTLAEIKKTKEDIMFRLIDERLGMMPYADNLINCIGMYYPMGFVSSADKNEVHKKIGKFDLIPLFIAMVTVDDITQDKPHPEPYIKGVELLNAKLKRQIPPESVIVIEDNPMGILSAKNAGCRTIAYPNGFTKDMDFNGADAVVSSLKEINDHLLRRVANLLYTIPTKQ